MARRDPSKRDVLLEAYRTGLKTLKGDRRLRQTALTDEAVEEVADALLRGGLRDYFDRLTYSTAAYMKCSFLTEDDEQFHTLGGLSSIPKPRRTVRWDKLVKEL